MSAIIITFHTALGSFCGTWQSSIVSLFLLRTEICSHSPMLPHAVHLELVMRDMADILTFGRSKLKDK